AIVEGVKWSKDMREQLKTMQRDVASLTDHASYLSNKITFVLDAMLGVVNLEQNNIIKLFSVMAVVLMPPTLIASIYGMNFKAMPELEWAHGYPMALVMMLAAAIVPYWIFKWKKWLCGIATEPLGRLRRGGGGCRIKIGHWGRAVGRVLASLLSRRFVGLQACLFEMTRH